MEKTSPTDLEKRLADAEERTRQAERKFEVAKRELLSLSTDHTPETVKRLEARVVELEEDVQSLREDNSSLRQESNQKSEESQRWRVSYLAGELDKSLMEERIAETEERLNTVVKPLSFDDQKVVQERSLAWMALQDPLTGLPNQNKLEIQLDWAVQRANEHDELAVLLVLDLDRFQAVNEFGGWQAGNDLLKEIGQRISNLVAGSETFIARRGEDEFALIFTLERPQGPGTTLETPMIRVRQLADLVLQVFDKPFETGGHSFPVKASMGLSICPDDADTGQDLLENAHAALATAKATKRGSYLFFNDKIYGEKEQRAGLATELARAIQEESLLFLYRPVVGVSRGTLAGAQVEAYWDHPNHGRVSEADFIALAEELGLAYQLAQQTLQAAFELSRKVRGSIPTIVSLPTSVLGRTGAVKEILEQVGKARIRPESLTLELNGDALVRRPDDARRFMEELEKWRIGRSIGHLGSTPLPLMALQATRPGTVGLALEVTEQVPQIEGQAALAKGLMSLLKQLNLEVKVGGVSNKTQAQFLAVHDCDYVYGDFLSPSLDLETFLARKRTTWTLK